MKVLKMEAEVVGLMRTLKRPIHFSDDELGLRVEIMTKLFIERIDSNSLKADLPASSFGKETKDKIGGLKTLQLWLDKRISLGDAAQVMSALFVLYDLRIAYKHLLSASAMEETFKTCKSRLNLGADASLKDVYLTLISALEKSFKEFSQAAEKFYRDAVP